MHQSNDYIKRKLGLCRVQECIPLVGAISAHICAGPQNIPTHVRQYRAEYGRLGKAWATFAMVQYLQQSNDYIKRMLGLWRAQTCIFLVGARNALRCAGSQITTTHVRKYRAEHGVLGKSGATFRLGAVFAPKQ